MKDVTPVKKQVVAGPTYTAASIGDKPLTKKSAEQIIVGFAKRASEAGLTKSDAFSLFKTAGVWDGLLRLLGKGSRAASKTTPLLEDTTRQIPTVIPDVAAQAGKSSFKDFAKQDLSQIPGWNKASPLLAGGITTGIVGGQQLSSRNSEVANANDQIGQLKGKLDQSSFSPENLQKMLDEYGTNLKNLDPTTLGLTLTGVGGAGLAGKGLADMLSSNKRSKRDQEETV